MNPQPPYILRPQVETFQQELILALQEPDKRPIVFNVYGIGGVGKTRLTQRIQEVSLTQPNSTETGPSETGQGARVRVENDWGEAVETPIRFAAVSFGETENIEEPIPLMRKLYEVLSPPDPENQHGRGKDPFWEKYNLYFETIHKLETKAASGRGAARPEQVVQVKDLLKFGVDVAGEFFLSEGSKQLANKVVDRGMDLAVQSLSLKDSLQQFVQQHQATKKDRALQALMLSPLPKLTQAFAEGLKRQAQWRPVVLILDTYEKAPSSVDTWLWRTFLGNNSLQPNPVRLLVAGRFNLREREGWRKLQQDHDWICSLGVDEFTDKQAEEYLREIGIEDATEIMQICRVTKRLPYYLNWVREQRVEGQVLDFSKGNAEIVKLLLQGLNGTQKLVIQMAACCRGFDQTLIRYLVEQQGLDFATAVDEAQNCYGWLQHRSFVVLRQGRYRLDDVAREVFRRDLRQEDQDLFYQIQGRLAAYFKRVSDDEAPPEAPPRERYENPDWRRLRGEFLYYLCFCKRTGGETCGRLVFRSHLLEARYFRQDDLVQEPFKAILADGALAENPFLPYAMRKFLEQLKPAVVFGSAVLEETPLDGVSKQILYMQMGKVEVEQALQGCVAWPEQLRGLAKFAALLYKAEQCSPGDAFQYLQKAQEQAEAVVQLDDDPEFGSGIYLWHLGNRFSDLGHYEDALASYDKAVEIKPDDHTAWYNRGVALLGLGRNEDAIASYDQAIEIKPDDPEAWSNRGSSQSNLGRYEEAIASYDKAIEIKPDYPEAFSNRSIALYHLGRYEEAIASCDQAIEIKPDYPEAWSTRGGALVNLGRYEEAIASCDQAMEIKPDSHEAWYTRACIYALLNQVEPALVDLQRAIELNPEHYRKLAQTDSDFDLIRADERFQAAIN